MYRMSLTPPPGERYFITNVTVKNVKSTAVNFSDTVFALLTAFNIAHYSNFAICNKNCTSALGNRTLSAGFESDPYVLSQSRRGPPRTKCIHDVEPPIVMSAV